MGNRITTSDIKVVTKEGEVHLSITLDLNINLNGQINGVGQVSAAEPKEEEKKKETDYVIPDFSSLGRIKFGKSKDEQENE